MEIQTGRYKSIFLLSKERNNKEFFLQEEFSSTNIENLKNTEKIPTTISSKIPNTIKEKKTKNKKTFQMTNNTEMKNTNAQPKKRKIDETNNNESHGNEQMEEEEEDQTETFNETWELRIDINDDKHMKYENLIEEFKTYESLDRLRSYINPNTETAILYFYDQNEFEKAAKEQIDWGEMSIPHNITEQAKIKRDKELKYRTFFTTSSKDWEEEAKKLGQKMNYINFNYNRVDEPNKNGNNALICFKLSNPNDFKNSFNYKKILKANHLMIPKMSYFNIECPKTIRIFYRTKKRINVDEFYELKIDGILGIAPFFLKDTNAQLNSGWAFIDGKKTEWINKTIDLPNDNSITFQEYTASQNKKNKKNEVAKPLDKPQ